MTSPLAAASFDRPSVPAGRAPAFTPTAGGVAQSQLTAFAASLGTSAQCALNDPTALHAFSVSRYREFWGHLLAWSGLRWEGSADRVCVGERCETARFFPDLLINYAENVLAAERTKPEAVAITSVRADGRRTHSTRGELKDRVERLAAALQQHGIAAGDSVAAILRNDTEAVVAALAVAAVGARLAVAAPEMGAHAMAARLAPLAPRLLMAHAGALAHDTGMPVAERVARVAAALPSLTLLVVLDDTAAQVPPSGVAARDLSSLCKHRAAADFTWQRFPFDQPLFVMASADATGGPRNVVHGAGGVLLEHVKEHRLHVDLRPSDRLFFQTSCAWMMWHWQLSALASGSQIVLYDGPIRDATTLWRIVHEERVTVFGTSPPYLKLGEHAGLKPGSSFDLRPLRAILCTGSALYEPACRWVRDQVKAVPLQSMTGSPDCLACFVLGHPNLPVYPGECQSRGLGLDLRAVPAPASEAERPPFDEMVCANPFPSRPLGLLGDADGSQFHARYFARHPGLWSEGELIEFMPEGSARLHGRVDGVMNVRGIRIGPAEVYEVLREFEQISEAMVVEQHSPAAFTEGRAVLLLVMREGVQLDGSLTARVRRRLAEAASAAHVPDVILQVAEFPRTQAGEVSAAAMRDAVNGMPVRNLNHLQNPACLDVLRDAPALRARDLLASQLAPPPAPGWRSRKDHEAYLRGLWERMFGFSPIGLDDDFFELGGHSLLAARMLADIQRSTSQELALSTLLKAPTIRQLAGVIDAAAWDLPVPLVQLRPGTGRPFFLMHSLAGNFLELWAVLRALDTTRPVYGLQARGLGAGEVPHLRVPDMASEYIGHMRRVQPEGPYAVGGYSFGGLVAYEIAQQLRRAGEDVELLTLIDTHVHGRHLPLWPWLQHCAAWMALNTQRVKGLPRRERMDFLKKKSLVVIDRLRGMLGLAPKWPDLVGDLVREGNFPPALRRVRGAMLVAMREYRPVPYPGRAVFLRAAEKSAGDPLPMWRKVVRGGLDVSVTPGDHYDMIAGANAKALAQALARHL